MKKNWFFLALLPFFLMAAEARAWVSVPDAGDTGWQTYVYQAGEAGFTGTAGFVVSNVLDDAGYSNLLLDNLSQGGDPANRAFEIGDYSGYTLLGGSYARVTGWAMAYSGKVYHPTQGKYFSNQACVETGVNTTGFQNGNRQAGTIGSILETSISLPPGGKFTFDWAFLAGDLSPYNDFALFYLKDAQGQIVFSDGLAQIGPVSPGAKPPTITVILGLLSLLGGREASCWPANLGGPGRGWAGYHGLPRG